MSDWGKEYREISARYVMELYEVLRQKKFDEQKKKRVGIAQSESDFISSHAAVARGPRVAKRLKPAGSP